MVKSLFSGVCDAVPRVHPWGHRDSFRDRTAGFSVSFSWLSARRAISIAGLAFPPGDTGGQQQVTICAGFFPAEQGHPPSTFLSPLPQIPVRISQIRI